MKQVTINLYSIDELSKEAQERAFEKYYHFNVEYRNWYEFQYDDFVSLCETIGINIAEDEIFFSGFWSQGDGSTFESTINAKEFLNGIKGEKGKEFAPNLEFNFESCPCDDRVITLILNGEIECTWRTNSPNRGYWIDFDSDYYWVWQDSKDYSNIRCQLEILDRWIKKILNELNRHLYQSLEEEYIYQTSPIALKETFIANEYLFTVDGEMAKRLLKLVECQTNQNIQ